MGVDDGYRLGELLVAGIEEVVVMVVGGAVGELEGTLVVVNAAGSCVGCVFGSMGCVGDGSNVAVLLKDGREEGDDEG